MNQVMPVGIDKVYSGRAGSPISHRRTVVSPLPLANVPPSGLKRNAPDPGRMSREGGYRVSCDSSPQSHRVVVAPASEQGAIRVERNTINTRRMSWEYSLGSSGGNLPQNDRIISTSTGERTTISVKRNALNPGGMPYECVFRLSVGNIPYAELCHRYAQWQGCHLG